MGSWRCPRRQEIQPSAFISCMALQHVWQEGGRQDWLPIIALSYCWLTPEHPDPKSEQFSMVAKVVDILLASGDYNDYGMFIDWCSLCQGPDRSEAEDASFRESLRHINLWYAHNMTMKWLLTAVPEAWS